MLYVVLGSVAVVLLILWLASRLPTSPSGEASAAGAQAAERNAYNAYLAGTITIDGLRESLFAAGTDPDKTARILEEAPRLLADIRSKAADTALPTHEDDVAQHLEAFICGRISQAEFERPMLASGMSRAVVDRHIAAALKLRRMLEETGGS